MNFILCFSVMQRDALQQKLNEAMMQSQKVTMQMSEMTQDLRIGLRERETLNMEKQQLGREMSVPFLIYFLQESHFCIFPKIPKSTVVSDR